MTRPADPAELALFLGRVRDAVLSGSHGPGDPRPLVSASWQRSLAARVDPDDDRPPITYADDQLAAVREAHPLHAVLPLLRQTLVSIADDAQHVMIVTDADGTILWCEGSTSVLLKAQAVGLTAGTRWSEEAIGTNAMGTTLAVDAPVQIYSAEHLVRTYHNWTCAAAPVHDPDTGRILGAIDVSGPLHTVHPATNALVAAAAQLAEGQLRVRMAARDELFRSKNMEHLAGLRGEPGALLTPSGRVVAAQPLGPWPTRLELSAGPVVQLPDGRAGVVEPLSDGYLLRVPRTRTAVARRRALRLRFLGGPAVTLDDRPLPITLRHAEILTLLALHPAGLTADQLALGVYGEDGNPTTVRAEIHRLRAQLGADVVQTRPYRLGAEVDADFRTVRSALRSGQVGRALDAAVGELLARSDAPAIRAERAELTAALRHTVLAGRDVEALWTLAQREPGVHDLELWDVLLEMLPLGDPRAPEVAAHRQRLLAED